jgi:hypothetical protein
MLKKLKNDFISVRWSLGYVVGREIPLWIAILYYATLAPICLLLWPLGKFYMWCMMRRFIKIQKEWEA